MEEKPLKTLAEQTLIEYQKKTNYLTLQGRQQLQHIRRAIVAQIGKNGPKTKEYEAFKENVDRQIAFRQNKQKRHIGQRNIQTRKVASEIITRKQLTWTTFVSLFIGGVLVYLKRQDSEGWPWWGCFLVGLIATLIIGLTIVILYNCKWPQKLEEQEAIRKSEKSQINLNR